MRVPGLLAGVAAALWLLPAAADPVTEPEDDLFDLTLEELASVPVVSVTGRASDWFQTPAAVHVITRDELRRSGHTSLIESMRMVPGFYVGRIDTGRWATGIRGFSGGFYPHLQALVDGRVIYNELFSGVYWDVATPLLEDVESIEVIRGPGATLWGANAVNGVLNVTTRSASDTHGTYLSGGGGTEEQAFGMARYGAELFEGVSLRGWGRYIDRDRGDARAGGSLRNGWGVVRGGLRLDAELGKGTALMAQGEGYTDTNYDQALGVPGGPNGQRFGDNDVQGGHALVRLSHERGSIAEYDAQRFSLQAYYDADDRRNLDGFDQERQTVDIDARHHIMLAGRHELAWGAGYRYRRTDTEATLPPAPPLGLQPADRDSHLTTAFVQDTVTLIEDELFLMIGSKLEYNSWTHFEVQPSGRLWWTPNERHTLWGAISRPVRTPSLVEQYLSLDLGPGGSLVGSTRLDAERLLAYEAGYRVRPKDGLVLDLAAFFFDYDDLIDQVRTSPALVTFRNQSRAYVTGAELAARWRPLEQWRLHASYSYLHVDAKDTPAGSEREIRDPEHQFQIRSYLDVTEALEFNSALYFVDSIPRFGGISSYFRLDLGLTWHPTEQLELSVWGQNLTQSEHVENGEVFMPTPTSGIERGVYGRASLRF
jgi:iron complex outermembrane receptor protein